MAISWSGRRRRPLFEIGGRKMWQNGRLWNSALLLAPLYQWKIKWSEEKLNVLYWILTVCFNLVLCMSPKTPLSFLKRQITDEHGLGIPIKRSLSKVLLGLEDGSEKQVSSVLQFHTYRQTHSFVWKGSYVCSLKEFQLEII